MTEVRNGLQIIRSEKLSMQGLVFGMSTRHGGVSPSPLGLNLSFNVGDDPANVRKNRALFFGELNIPLDRLAFPMQEHSAGVLRIDEPGRYSSCDALTTNKSDVYLCISAADCVPVFLYDRARKAIAGIHAGWRGTAAGIVRGALECMRREFSTDVRDLIAFIGPSADKCCYVVGPDVAGAFNAKFSHVKDGSSTVDLKGANRQQLLDAGVPADSIEVSPLCTISESHLLHSYRRDGAQSGRMLAVLGLRS